MNKVIICLTGCLLALGTLRAQDNSRQTPDSTKQAPDSVRQMPVTDSIKPAQDAPQQVKDTMIQVKDTTIQVSDTSIRMKDTTIQVQGVAIQVKGNNIHVKDTANSAQPDSTQSQNSSVQAKDVAVKDSPAQTKDADQPKDKDKGSEESLSAGRQMDRRWFISPLLKGQFQDFAFLEKNRKGYLSDANTLPFLKRGNASFAASAYKNLTGRLSFSADIGLSFGHVTNDSKLISQTESKTYNLLNATVYYHLLGPSYHIQPYVSIGINDIINDASYASAPIGLGAKFTAKKIMVTGQIAYGYAVSKNVSNTTMYSLGIYIPIKSKKQKQLDEEDKSPYNRSKKDNKDTTSKNGPIVNNIYITIKLDSLLKAQGLGGDGRRKGNGVDDADGNGDDGSSDGSSSNGNGRSHKKKSAIKNFNFEDFSSEDYKVDTLDGEPVIRFVIYFEFNEYSLNSKAFNSVDKVIGHLRDKPNLYIEIKGYTDDVGTEQYNNFLSRRRAKMVMDYMNSRGVASEYMKAKAYGSDNPVGDNKDPNQAWLNRRAEIIVHEK
jgi:outer membrane protein OmpA-like peptidoglycan-associated protein